jgi:hypothetical protein
MAREAACDPATASSKNRIAAPGIFICGTFAIFWYSYGPNWSNVAVCLSFLGTPIYLNSPMTAAPLNECSIGGFNGPGKAGETDRRPTLAAD